MLALKKSRYITALLLAVPLIAGLSACGTTETRSTPDSQKDQTQTFDSFEEYQLAFAKCMRGKGIDMEDPNANGQEITKDDGGFMEAAEACQSEIGKPPAREGDSGNQGNSNDALRAEHLEIAKCLREHGVDVPDPAPGEDLDFPNEVPEDAFETCAPNGVIGSTTRGN